MEAVAELSINLERIFISRCTSQEFFGCKKEAKGKFMNILPLSSSRLSAV